MKPLRYFAPLAALLLTLAACSPNRAITDKQASKFLKAFYAEAFFGSGDPAPAMERCCSERMQQQLQAARTHGGDEYALRMFLSGEPAGSGNLSMVTRVEPRGNTIYTVHFLDGSHPGKCHVKLVRSAEGDLKIDALFPAKSAE